MSPNSAREHESRHRYHPAVDLAAINAFVNSAPAATGQDNFDAIARAWLADNGHDAAAGTGPSCTIVAVGVDYDSDVGVFAVPNTLLDEAAHRDLAAVSGACFAYHFGADISPDRYAGALRIFGGTAEEVDIFEEQVDDMRADTDKATPGMDWEALLASAGAWNEYRLESGAALPGPVTHCYSARIAM